MAIFILTLCLLVSLIFARETQHLSLTSNQNDADLRIAFGSCFHFGDYQNSIFSTIARHQPHLWIWTGDAAYTDDVSHLGCKNKIRLKFKVLKSYTIGNSVMPKEYVMS